MATQGLDVICSSLYVTTNGSGGHCGLYMVTQGLRGYCSSLYVATQGSDVFCFPLSVTSQAFLLRLTSLDIRCILLSLTLMYSGVRSPFISLLNWPYTGVRRVYLIV